MPKLASLLLLAFLIASCKQSSSIVDNDLCGFGPQANQVCSWDGAVYVKAVDSRRVLVAVDAFREDMVDGKVDRMFMYTSAHPIEVASSGQLFEGHVEYSSGKLVVVSRQADEKPLEFLMLDFATSSFTAEAEVSRFTDAIGLSSHTGYRTLNLSALVDIDRASECSSEDCSVFRVGEARIEFPA